MTTSSSTATAGTSGASWVSGVLRVHADLELHGEEIQRRRAANATRPAQDLDTLRFLLSVDQPVAIAALGAYERGLTRRAVRFGFAEKRTIAGNCPAVVRKAEPPVTVELVSVLGPLSRRTLQLATTFAPYARRRLVVPSGRIDETLLLEANYYGVGVTVTDDDDERTLVTPAPFQPTRFTGASWLFAERMYAQAFSPANATARESEVEGS